MSNIANNSNLKNVKRNLRSNPINVSTGSPLNSSLGAPSSQKMWNNIESRLNDLTSTLSETILSTLRKELKAIVQSLNERINEMEANFITRITSLEKDFSDRFGCVNNLIFNCETKLSSLEDHCHEMNSQVDELSLLKAQIIENDNSHLKSQIDALARRNIAGDLVLHGIPVRHNENLHDTFNKFCTKLGLQSIQTHYIQRTTPKNNHNSSSAIIVRLPHENVKNNVLKKVNEYYKRNSRSVTLHDLGFENNYKFVRAYESLTKNNHDLFRKANDIRRRKLIHSVFTRYGRVFIREGADKKPSCVTSMTHLQLICSMDNQTNDAVLSRSSAVRGATEMISNVAAVTEDFVAAASAVSVAVDGVISSGENVAATISTDIADTF